MVFYMTKLYSDKFNQLNMIFDFKYDKYRKYIKILYP